MVEKGKTPEAAVARVREALKEKGRGALLPQIARAVKRLAEREIRKHRVVLAVARKHDEHAARKASGGKDAELAIDETLIGGWKLEGKGDLRDMSWKSYLLSMYHNAITQ